MPSHKKLRPRRSFPTLDSENTALDGVTFVPLRCSLADQPPLRSANGHNRHRPFTSDEKICNLVRLNDTLVKELSTLRNKQSEVVAIMKSLEERLQSSCSNRDELSTQLDRLRNDVTGFEREKTALLAERDELDDALSDLSVRQQQLKEELEAERKASATYKNELRALMKDVDVLRMDNEKLVDHYKKLADENEDVIEQCHSLKSENNDVHCELKTLKSKEAALAERLASLERNFNDEQLRAVNASKTIEALQTEVTRSNEAAVKVEDQLNEASRRVDELETHHAAAVERQCSLESQVIGLERELLTERDAHGKVASELEQERRAKEVGILAVACQIDKLRVEKEKLIDDGIGYKSLITSMQTNIKHRQEQEVKLEEALVNERSAHAAARLEITNAEAFIKNLQDEAAYRDETVSKLEKELNEASQRNVVLEAQSATASDRQIELELQVSRLEGELSVTRTELLNASSALEQERAAKEDAICSLTCKVKHLSSDKEKLIEENNALSNKNSGFQRAMKQIQSKEATLGKEVTKLRNSYSSAQQKINDLNKVTKTLVTEASTRNAEVAKFEERLKESSQHIACLETQRVASMEIQQKLESQIMALQNDLREHEMQAKESLKNKSRQAAMLEDQLTKASEQITQHESHIAVSIKRQTEQETQIKDLENELLASSGAHLSASSALEKETQARTLVESLLEASQAKTKSVIDHLEAVKSCLLGKEYNSNTDPQSFQSLQCQLSALMDEKKVLEETKAALEKKVSALSARSTQAALNAKVESDKLTEQLRQLQLALNDARNEACQRDGKLDRLELDLRRAKIFLEDKARLVRFALPVAVASTSALFFVGLLTYLGGAT